MSEYNDYDHEADCDDSELQGWQNIANRTGLSVNKISDMARRGEIPAGDAVIQTKTGDIHLYTSDSADAIVSNVSDKITNKPKNKNMPTTDNTATKKLKKVLTRIQSYKMFNYLILNFDNFNKSNVSWTEITKNVNSHTGLKASVHVVYDAMTQISQDLNKPLISKKVRSSSIKIDTGSRSGFISSVLGASPKVLDSQVQLKVQELASMLYDLTTNPEPELVETSNTTTPQKDMAKAIWHMFSVGAWHPRGSGSSSTLLKEIVAASKVYGFPLPENFPTNPTEFGMRLYNSLEELRAQGFLVTRTRNASIRIWTITPVANKNTGFTRS